MHLTSTSFKPYGFLDPAFCFGKHDPKTHFTFGGNKNPHLAWSDVPDETKSFALICVDIDVPSEADDVNQEGKTVAVDLPRVEFYHWVVADLPASCREIAEGAHSDGVTPTGKATGETPDGGVAGLNDFTAWFAEDDDMGGEYGGYDGPGPPWNDARMHGYRFQVYALDVASLDLEDDFDGDELMDTMEEHIIDSCELIALYAINPDVAR